jgi:hypothetical protein
MSGPYHPSDTEQDWTWHVNKQEDGRYEAVIRFQGHPETDFVVAADFPNSVAAQEFVDKLRLAGMFRTDVRRITDYAVRRYIKEPWELIY